MVKPLGRKVIGQKLREENKEVKKRKRYPKYRPQSEVTIFVFNIVGVVAAERLLKDMIK